MFAHSFCWTLALLIASFVATAAGFGTISRGAEGAAPDGRELFIREWLPKDSRSQTGDGLGPMFNDTSCVGCHNQGGAGGGGSAAKNVQIVSAFSNPSFVPDPSLITALAIVFRGPAAALKPPMPASPLTREEKIKAERAELAKIHPGFQTANSLVLHRFSTDPKYSSFRGKLTNLDSLSDLEQQQSEVQFRGLAGRTSIGEFTFLVSERNTPALFGAGKIDAIPEKVILSAADEKFPDYPQVSGRAARLKDKLVGRFGWKGQKARLADFVLTACAVELGLHVPGESQSGIPHSPDYQAPGQDLGEKECQTLIAFVARLPQPAQRVPASKEEEEYSGLGKKLFAEVGCAACHRPQLGDVIGIYSDLLLHDMGPQLTDSGSYGSFVPNTTEDDEMKQPLPALTSTLDPDSRENDNVKLIGATRNEWRTPPLWGVRDSAPYLHDGRAATLEQAIALHGGEATLSARKFYSLSSTDRLRVTLFLRSLTAPE